MRSLKYKLKVAFLIAFDACLAIVSLYLAFLLRFDFDVPENEIKLFFSLPPLIIFCRLSSYYFFSFYSRLWKYSTLEDLIVIIQAVSVGSILIFVSTFFYDGFISIPKEYFRFFLIPRTILILDWFLLIIMIGGSRLLWRMWSEKKNFEDVGKAAPKIRALIFGAGDKGVYLLKHLRSDSPEYLVEGFIDDDPSKKNSSIMGVKVLGDERDLSMIVREKRVHEILISINNISSERLSEIIDSCNRSQAKFKMVASTIDRSNQERVVTKIKNIEISDLLEREAVVLDLSLIKRTIKGKRVLVTGAGGSIGSELCRQVLGYEPSSLVMMDIGENYLYELKMFLWNSASKCETHFIFGSVTNEAKMEAMFEQHRPQLIFHAAAHKHVPIMEDNVDAAIVNNILGTKITADLSGKFEAENFILISTDKVVNPTSIMGRTKNIAEKYIQSLSKEIKTKFITVRFGNVLGSNGSVVPLFQKQIQQGGPVTITHPEMTRFFMLIPEAVQLILQAITIGAKRDVFLLDMGKPVRIMDLADKMIKLAGYTPDKEIKIEFTGIRPGEKLHEELTNDQEGLVETGHKKISLVKSQILLQEDFRPKLDELFSSVNSADPEIMKLLLMQLASNPHQSEKTMRLN
ncbi:MAG: polysaccharide biosynthesis protein [Nitrospinae bacterium]|nr:polysaccharide biosynthesis protein [Nitrospinota bacterium]